MTTMTTPSAPALSEIVICSTCRPPGNGREAPAAGAQLLDAAQQLQSLDDTRRYTQLRVREVQCMSSCSQACTAAIQAPGKLTYLFGGLAPDIETAAQLLDCARLHQTQADGTLARNERPERLRQGILARIPAAG